MTEEERETLVNIFSYHKPTLEKIQLHEEIRSATIAYVLEITEIIPHSRERSIFITKMQEAQMMANASLALHR